MYRTIQKIFREYPMMDGGRNFFGTNNGSPVNGPLSMVAMVMALASSAVLTPIIYNHTFDDFVSVWIMAQYGDYTGIGGWVYSLLLGAVVFSLARILWLFLVMALVAATVSLSYRFIPAMAI